MMRYDDTRILSKPSLVQSLTNIPCPDTCLAMENRVSPLPSLRFATLPIMLVRIPCCLTVRLLDHNISWKVTIPAIQVTKQHHAESKSRGPKSFSLSSLSFNINSFMLSTALCGSMSLSTKVSAVSSVFHCSHMKGLHVLFTWIFSVPSCQFPIAASVCCLCSNLSEASPDNSACCYLDHGRLLLAVVNVAKKFLQEPWSGCSASYTMQDSNPSSHREASGNCGSGNEKSTTVSGAPFL